MGIAPDSILGQAVEVVTDQMSKFEVLSQQYNNNLSLSLHQIASVQIDDVDAPERLQAPSFSQLGAIKDYVPKNIDLPADYDITSLFAGLDKIPDAPTFNIPPAPTIVAKASPSRPSIDTNISLPDAPVLNMPELPEMHKISIPDFVMPEMPLFEGKDPSVDGINIPDVFINWSEPEYKSELLESIQSKLHGIVTGNDTKTGLPKPVEDALFNRSRERQLNETERAVQEVVDTWASRGYTMPQGWQAKQADIIRQQGRLQAAELNRDILAQATQWEIETLRFAVQQGIALEQLTQNLYSNMAARLFEVAKFQAEAQISVFNARISLYNAEVSAYNVAAQTYKTKLEGALAKLDAYRTAIQAQAAIGEVNRQHVDVYRAQIDAVQSNVDIYKAMMTGTQIKADIVRTQLDAYRADIQAHSEQLNAEKIKLDTYEAQLRGESAKANVFEAQIRAYSSRVQASSTIAQAKTSKYAADIDAFKAKLQADIDVYRAQMQAFSANADTQARFADMTSRTNIAYAQMQISEYQTKMQKATQQAQIALEAAKAVGQYSAQLAAGALSAQHVSASISGSGSASSSESKSTSTSHSYSY